MSLPLKFYRIVNYVQLTISLYGFVWLSSFFSASISCSTIDNYSSVNPYLLRYGRYLIPECTSGGAEWIIGSIDSFLLRILFIAWIVISFFVFIRIRRIRRYVSESEPVEFIKNSKKGKKSIPLFGSLTDLVSEIQVPRILKIVLSITLVWVLFVILFQDALVSGMKLYIQEHRFSGTISSISVRYSRDGVASIYLSIDQNLVLMRSDKNVRDFFNIDSNDNGYFEGLENFILEDQFLSSCLVGRDVEVYGRKSSTFYSLDGSRRYYVRFTNGIPTCQNVYMSGCINGDERLSFGEKVQFNEEGVICTCTTLGLSCLQGEIIPIDESSGRTCSYFGTTYASGQSFSTEDECGVCECEDSYIQCAESSECLATGYEANKNFEIPLYYWFVDEPEPSRMVYLSAGKSDSFEIVAYRPFGQSPKSELNLSGSEASATLVFTDAQSFSSVLTPETHLISGNVEYPELVRFYSPDAKGYYYAQKQSSIGECGNAGNVGKKCYSNNLDGVIVQCKSTDGGYKLCDTVMRTFSLELSTN